MVDKKARASYGDLSRAIRAQCIECFGGVQGEVERCTSPGCSLYPYRMGSKMKGRFGRKGNLTPFVSER